MISAGKTGKQEKEHQSRTVKTGRLFYGLFSDKQSKILQLTDKVYRIIL